LLKIGVFVAVLAVVYYYARIYFNGGVCTSTTRMDGKVVVITGANTGIGKETVVDLLERGAQVYMACRSLSRGQAALEEVRQRTGVDNTKVSVLQLDLASFASIRQFVQEFKKREKKLDVLINNAGVMTIPQRQETEDGNEMQFGTNHLGHFLLTNLLLDTLIASAPSRVVTVSSLAHIALLNGELDLEDLNSEKAYDPQTAYGRSKSANIMFSRELAKRLQGTGVTTYSLHPGAIFTELQRHWWWLDTWAGQNIVKPIMGTFFKTVPQGAQTQICCAVDEALANESGKYYSDCAEKAPSSHTENDADCKTLWQKSVELTKLQPNEMVPEVKG